MLVMSFMVTLFAGCGGPSGADTDGEGVSDASSGEKVVWKLSHNAQPGQAIDEGTIKFAELVKEKTNGRVEVELYPNNILGPDHSTREMVVEGTVQMVAMGNAFLSPYAKAVDLTAMLYCWTDRDEMMTILNGDWGQKWINEPFLENGIRLLGHWPNADRLLISKRPVRSKADLSGLKIRVPAGMPIWETTWTELGAMTLSLSLEDSFTGMQQGVVDAVEMPLDFLYNYRFMEEAKYLTLTNHNIYTQFIVVNEAAFQALSQEDQQAVQEAVEEAGQYATQLLDDKNEELLQDMVENYGVEVIDLSNEQRAEFQDAMGVVYEDLMDTWGQEAYDDLMAARAEYASSH